MDLTRLLRKSAAMPFRAAGTAVNTTATIVNGSVGLAGTEIAAIVGGGVALATLPLRRSADKAVFALTRAGLDLSRRSAGPAKPGHRATGAFRASSSPGRYVRETESAAVARGGVRRGRRRAQRR